MGAVDREGGSRSQRRLVVEVALTFPLPLEIRSRGHPQRVYIVVDVVRATTTLCLFFELGAQRVLVAPGVAAAQAARARLGSGYLLAGEVGGARPPDFDLGNSPSELAGWDLSGRELVYATTNGTRALHACQGGRAIISGSLRNASAVAQAALAAVESVGSVELGDVPTAAPFGTAADIVIVCAGLGDRPAFDDTLCAGYLARRLTLAAEERGLACDLGEGARIAHAVCEQVLATGGLRAALATSEAGRAIAAIGLGADLEWCAAVDATPIVPWVAGVAANGELLAVAPYRQTEH